MLFLRKKSKSAHKKSEKYVTTHAVGLLFHPGHGGHATLLPNNIVGLCSGPPNGSDSGHHKYSASPHANWIRTESDWAPQACVEFGGTLRKLSQDNQPTLIRITERNRCPVHGHLHQHAESQAIDTLRKTNTMEKRSIADGERNRLISSRNAPGTETVNGSVSSSGQSYPETVSVHSQRSTPRSQRSEMRSMAGAVVPATVNWAELLPPPPQNPPPEAIPPFGCPESDNYSALDYKYNKFSFRKDGGQCSDRIITPRCRHGIVSRFPPEPQRGNGRTPTSFQASLDRRSYGHKYPMNRQNIRNSLVLEVLAGNMIRARSCESSIANEEDQGMLKLNLSDTSLLKTSNVRTQHHLNPSTVNVGWFLQIRTAKKLQKFSSWPSVMLSTEAILRCFSLAQLQILSHVRLSIYTKLCDAIIFKGPHPYPILLCSGDEPADKVQVVKAIDETAETLGLFGQNFPIDV